MGLSVFVSYSHAERPWVEDRLLPCLRAGGAQTLVDLERFRVGVALPAQMDAVQDAAAASLLVLSPTYLHSAYCQHELQRALALRAQGHVVLPVKRVDCPLPVPLAALDLLHADLRCDQAAAPWAQLLEACEATLGATAPEWLSARDETRRCLERGQSVNLVVTGDPQWRGLIAHLRTTFPGLGAVDLDRGTTVPRWGLVEEILQACGAPTVVPPEPGVDLRLLDRVLSARSVSHLVVEHFDRVAHRRDYDVDLFAALRYLVMESRKLVLLVQSRTPAAALLPPGHQLSNLMLTTVELRGRP